MAGRVGWQGQPRDRSLRAFGLDSSVAHSSQPLVTEGSGQHTDAFDELQCEIEYEFWSYTWSTRWPRLRLNSLQALVSER